MNLPFPHLALVLLATATTPAISAEFRLRLEAGEHDRAEAPLIFTVPAELAGAKRMVLLAEGGNNAARPIQWVDEAQRTAAFIAPALRAGQSVAYRLADARQPAPESAECRLVDGAVELAIRGRRVLRYHTAVVSPPPGADPVYRRSGHIHPVHTPDGRILTSEFPIDHLHQHGIFLAWVNTSFEGRKVDFWNQYTKTGHIEHVRTLGTTSGSVFAGFRVELRHSDASAPGGAKPVLKEIWTVRAWAVDDGHLFDVETRQTCIADSPLILNKFHYGGMAFRGTDQWFAGDKDAPVKRITDFAFVTSEGKDRIAGNATRPRWVVAHGGIDGRPASLIAMGHPSNARHPEPVRLHPSKPYFVFTPPALGEIRMEPGVEHVARYRFLVRDSPADQSVAERAWTALSNPPRVTVAKD